MSAHFVCFRCFPGLFDAFPYDRVIHLKDNALGAELDAIRAEWWSDQTNRDRYQTHLAALSERLRDWNAGILARPGVDWNWRPRADESVFSDLSMPTSPPSFQDLCPLTGWGVPDFSTFPTGVSSLEPIARFDSLAWATEAVAAFQARVAELAEQSNDRSVLMLNPRFVVIAEPVAGPELYAIRAHFKQLAELAGEHQTAEERIARLLLPIVLPTLEQLRLAEHETEAQQARLAAEPGVDASTSKNDTTATAPPPPGERQVDSTAGAVISADQTLTSEAYEAIVAVVGSIDGTMPAVIQIAGDLSKSVNDRIKAICDLHQPAHFWKSPHWARVLQTSSENVRMAPYWRGHLRKLRDGE